MTEMKPEKDAIWESLEDTQPIQITIDVFRDDCVWWEEFGKSMPATSGGQILASEEYQRPQP
jgi:hypothetical protein